MDWRSVVITRRDIDMFITQKIIVEESVAIVQVLVLCAVCLSAQKSKKAIWLSLLVVGAYVSLFYHVATLLLGPMNHAQRIAAFGVAGYRFALGVVLSAQAVSQLLMTAGILACCWFYFRESRVR